MASSDFHRGDRVKVASLKQEGIIEEILSEGRYRVAIGSLKLTCAAKDLAPATKVTPTGPSPSVQVKTDKRGRPPATIDLHGMTVDEAVRKLDQWLDSVILSDLSQVKVIHGLGTGRVQNAVHSHLATLKAVKRFKINEWNQGETDIYL